MDVPACLAAMVFGNKQPSVPCLARFHVILLTVGLIINQGDWYAEVAGEFLAVLIDVISTGAVNDDM